LQAIDSFSSERIGETAMAAPADASAKAAARAHWSAREIARRNRDQLGKALSPVMQAAATACELAHGPAAEKKRD
jgi:hypothetical protein